jgi:hypothetical protein
MFDHESKIPKDNLTTDKYPSWLRNILLDIHTEEIFQQGEERGIQTGQLHVARYFLCLLLEHRFGEIPRALYDYIGMIKDPDRLDTAFRQALIIEKIEDLRI